jgi:subfamily B ATP-binding cassette protein MsbA
MKDTNPHGSDWQLYVRLLKYVTPYWHIFLSAILALVLQAMTEPAKAALLQPMLDRLFVDKDPGMVMIIPLLIIGVFAVTGIAAVAAGISMNWISNNVVTDLRGDMFMKLLAFPSRYYDHHSVGSLISKFTFDVMQIKEAASNAITILVKDTLMVTGLLAWMIYMDWRLTCIALLSAPFIILIVSIIRSRLRRMSIKVQDTMADINHVLGEVIDGHRIVKLFGGQKQERERFGKIIGDNLRFTMKFIYASVASGPAVQFIAAVALAIIVYVAASRALSEQLTVGEFGSFFAAMAMMMDPLKRLVRINEHLQKGLAASESIFGLLDIPGETDGGSMPLPAVQGEIEIRNLDFHYEDGASMALKDIHLRIVPGETIALVGASGAGKTTLANLLPRFYQCDKGRIFIDGHDIHDVSLASLRDSIALVSQEIILFDDTVRNNIAYGAQRDAGEEEINAAAGAAHALEFIRDLPAGMDTEIGEKGARLSGGQRQRIALARALLKGAPIIILDEATSSLDAESERQIQSALEEIKRGRTCIIIAHRLSTIKAADRVYVLDGGCIVETGTHGDLLAKNGVYAKLYHSGQVLGKNTDS